MNDSKVIEHLMDIKERLASIETKVDDHAGDVKSLQKQVSRNSGDLKIMKVIGTFIMAAIPVGVKLWKD